MVPLFAQSILSWRPPVSARISGGLWGFLGLERGDAVPSWAPPSLELLVALGVPLSEVWARIAPGDPDASEPLPLGVLLGLIGELLIDTLEGRREVAR